MPPIESTQLGDFIRKTRQGKGMSLRSLAEASRLDWSYIGRLEKGEIGTPDPAKLQRLARALGVEVEDFYALAGYLMPEGLPELAPYLRAKYDLPEPAAEDIQRHLDRLKRRYEKPSPAAKKTRGRKR